MRVLFVFEHYTPPFDEGIKNFAHMVCGTLSEANDVHVVSDIQGVPVILNRLLLIPRVFWLALAWRPERVVYIPEGALTFFGCVKAWVFGRIFPRKVATVNVQKRTLSGWKKQFVKRLKIPGVFSFSSTMAKELREIGIDSKVIYAGIDRERFDLPAADPPLREAYGKIGKRPVLLHVGHIREARNIHWLKEIQKSMPEIQAILVGSTTTVQEYSLAEELEQAGVIVIRETLPAIEEMYQLATWYLFPVVARDAAMDIPLSVLEAMATNTPVISTRFGQLPELFGEDDCFHYVETVAEVIPILRQGPPGSCRNREKTGEFTWERTARLLTEMEAR